MCQHRTVDDARRLRSTQLERGPSVSSNHCGHSLELAPSVRLLLFFFLLVAQDETHTTFAVSTRAGARTY